MVRGTRRGKPTTHADQNTPIKTSCPCSHRFICSGPEMCAASLAPFSPLFTTPPPFIHAVAKRPSLAPGSNARTASLASFPPLFTTPPPFIHTVAKRPSLAPVSNARTASLSPLSPLFTTLPPFVHTYVWPSAVDQPGHRVADCGSGGSGGRVR